MEQKECKCQLVPRLRGNPLTTSRLSKGLVCFMLYVFVFCCPPLSLCNLSHAQLQTKGARLHTIFSVKQKCTCINEYLTVRVCLC